VSRKNKEAKKAFFLFTRWWTYIPYSYGFWWFLVPCRSTEVFAKSCWIGFKIVHTARCHVWSDLRVTRW
jgi:hypothetical protein